MKNFTQLDQIFNVGKRLLVLVPVVLGAASQSAHAQAQEFGVFTDRASVTNKLVYGPDVHIYLWNNLVDITPAPVPFEGTQVWAERSGNGADWFGMGVDNPSRNMTTYANGSLKFMYKTAYTGQVKIGVKSGSVESWVTFPAGSTQYGMVRDGSWHQVTIPVSAFQTLAPTLNVGAMTALFMFAGDPAGASNDFLFDDIYYTTAVATATAQATALAAACTLAPNPGQGRAQLAFTPAQATIYEAALYDLKGARVATIGSGTAAGNQLVTLPVDAGSLANGIYLVKLTTGQAVISKRLVVSH